MRLSRDKADWLRTVFESNGLFRKQVVSEKQKQDNKHLTLDLERMGLIYEREVTPNNSEPVKIWAFTNRGLCHLSIDSGVGLQAIFAMFPTATKAIQKEIELYKSRSLSDAEAELLWKCKAYKSLEYDFFDEQNNFRDQQTIPQHEIAKLTLDIYLKAVDDPHMRVSSMVTLLTLPPPIAKDIGDNRERLKTIIRQQLEMFRQE